MGKRRRVKVGRRGNVSVEKGGGSRVGKRGSVKG